jgi:hypothetical protein
LWNYLHDACDAAGILEVDFDRMEFDLGFRPSKEEINRVLANKGVWISDWRLFLPAFIEFQYGKLSPDCNPHRTIIRTLEKRRIDPFTLQFSEGYLKGTLTLQEQEQEKDISSSFNKENQDKNSQLSLADLLQTWKETLAHFEVDSIGFGDDLQIKRWADDKGYDQVRLALIGARHEPATKTFDPKNYISLSRILNQRHFQTNVNRGIQNKPKKREVYDVELPACVGSVGESSKVSA